MLHLIKCVFIIAILLGSTTVSGQAKYLKSNETTVLSFKTTSGKILMLALDKAQKYIVYRFGTAKHIEFEYPKDTANSFDKFKRFYYVRYGGIPNAGTEISQVEFTNDGFTYKIHEQYFATEDGERCEIGISIVDSRNKIYKLTKINGLVKTMKGSLMELKNSELVKLSHDSFNP
jgi:hypothetical protein